MDLLNVFFFLTAIQWHFQQIEKSKMLIVENHYPNKQIKIENFPYNSSKQVYRTFLFNKQYSGNG